MTQVLDENGNPAKISCGAIGWYDDIPVMWKYSLLLWLNPRELECIGREDDAFTLWKTLDPSWGEAWNQGIKEEFPIDFDIYSTDLARERLRMVYRDGKPVPDTEVSPKESYWIAGSYGVRTKAQWVDNYWKPYVPQTPDTF